MFKKNLVDFSPPSKYLILLLIFAAFVWISLKLLISFCKLMTSFLSKYLFESFMSFIRFSYLATVFYLDL